MRLKTTLQTLFATSLFCIATSSVIAGVVAVDANVPASMNAGGTEADPATYIR